MLISKDSKNVKKVWDIPFLPIQFFKSFEVKTGEWQTEKIYSSSGTTGSVPSLHHIRNERHYLQQSLHTFRDFFPGTENHHLLALLPSYLEREGSSLIAMINHWMPFFGEKSGFYLHDLENLARQIEEIINQREKFILFGVTFALIQLAEQFPRPFEDNMIFETGGMKGRGREWTREELHQFLKTQFNITKVYGEYGMTELLSQAYAKGDGVFYPSKDMHFVIRDINDPFNYRPARNFGGLNIIDLMNEDSCAFIQTDDLARYNSGGVEILGRLDQSDIRGCNLLVAG